MQAQDIPVGYCQCGCGEKTKIAPYDRRDAGWVKGEPIRFIHNHHARVVPKLDRLQALLSRRAIDANGCWVWMGHVSPDGYGTIHAPEYATGRKIGVHRLSWMLHVGPIPDGLEIDHLCRNRACFNPEHLEPVTKCENQRRGLVNQNTTKTHCPHGHPYSPDNTFYTNGGRRRHCRTCLRDWKRRMRAKKKERTQ